MNKLPVLAAFVFALVISEAKPKKVRIRKICSPLSLKAGLS